LQEITNKFFGGFTMCVEDYELKPCPRCGGKGKVVDVYSTDSIVGDTIATAFAIQCTKCNALGKHTQQIQLPLDAKILIDALLEIAAIYWNFGLMSD
jgi:hypothetical protein